MEIWNVKKCKFRITIQSRMRRSYGECYPQTGRSSSHCCVGWTEGAPVCFNGLLWKSKIPREIQKYPREIQKHPREIQKDNHHLIPPSSRWGHGSNQKDIKELQLEDLKMITLVIFYFTTEKFCGDDEAGETIAACLERGLLPGPAIESGWSMYWRQRYCPASRYILPTHIYISQQIMPFFGGEFCWISLEFHQLLST